MLGIVVFLVILVPQRADSQGPSAPRRHRSLLAQLAGQVEPNLDPQVERLDHYVEFFRLQLANDSRLFAFDVKAAADAPGRVRLTGYVEFEETRRAIEEFLQTLGFAEVQNDLATLPDASLGDKRFAFVTAAHTLSYDRPRAPRGVVTDCLLGEPLFVLRSDGDSLLVHSAAGYLGYVAAADVVRVGPAEFDAYPSDQCVRIVADHAAGDGLTLPMGAVLKAEPSGGDAVRCILPTGAAVDVPREKCQLIPAPTGTVELAIAAGLRLQGTPYLWGGRTSSGIDCSGLVHVAYAAIGVQLPRDSNQQILVGPLIATRWHRSGLRRGDTLYFVGPYGKIRHTALYLGDDRFLQAIQPRVVISSLNPEHDDYDAKRAKSFVFAKRPL